MQCLPFDLNKFNRSMSSYLGEDQHMVTNAGQGYSVYQVLESQLH